MSSLTVNISVINIGINNVNNLSSNSTCLDDGLVRLLSQEQLQVSKYVLFYVVLPIVSIIGILGNTISLTILRVSQQGYAFKVYLMALTSVDILLLLTALTRCVFKILSTNTSLLYPGVVIYCEYYLSVLLGGWLQRMSAILISIISIERFVAVIFPFKVKTIVIENHPIKILIVVIAGTFTLQLPTLALIAVKEKLNPSDNSTVYMFALRDENSASELTRNVYLITLAVLYMFVPVVIVSCSTICVVIRLKMHSSKNRFPVKNVKEGRDRDTVMTITLIGMAIIFTICHLPHMAIFLLPVVDAEFYKRESALVAIIVDVNVVGLCLNSSTDFIIYLLASRHFRRLFVKPYLRCFFTCRRLNLSSFNSSSSSPTTCSGKADDHQYDVPYYIDTRGEVSTTDITEM